MNRLNDVKKLNEKERQLGVTVGKGSWHDDFRGAAWVYVGGLPKRVTEGDVLVLMGQFGPIQDMVLGRERDTGAPRGHAFVRFENWLSTVLAVDNMNGATLGRERRRLNVDHAQGYEGPRTAEGAVEDTEYARWFQVPPRTPSPEEPQTRDEQLTALAADKAARKAERAALRANRDEKKQGKKRKSAGEGKNKRKRQKV